MNAPPIIRSLGIVGAPVKYKWSEDIAISFDDTENVRLYNAIDLSSFRAKMAIGAMLAELTVWRFDGLVDIQDGLLRVEAAWASVIDPEYVNDLEFETIADDDSQPVEGAYQSALYYLGESAADYLGKNIYLAEAVTKQASLARHVLLDKQQFDAWLKENLRQVAAAYPRTSDYDENTELYDARHEQPIPKAFFDPAYVHSDATWRAALSDFLASLDHRRNPYLRSPKEMAQHGFAGTAYRF